MWNCAVLFSFNGILDDEKKESRMCFNNLNKQFCLVLNGLLRGSLEGSSCDTSDCLLTRLDLAPCRSFLKRKLLWILPYQPVPMLINKMSVNQSDLIIVLSLPSESSRRSCWRGPPSAFLLLLPEVCKLWQSSVSKHWQLSSPEVETSWQKLLQNCRQDSDRTLWGSGDGASSRATAFVNAGQVRIPGLTLTFSVQKCC